jgi:hypothetical protein
MLHLPFLQPPRSALVLGRTGRFSFFPLYSIPERARSAHMYVIGITGKGKSKLLENCIVQDIQAGRGCVLIDPHSDLAEDVLRSCLSRGALGLKDHKRLIYFEPTRQDYVIPFNVLAGSEEPYQIAQRIVEAFRRTWPDALKEAPHFSNVATAALITLIENKLTLIDMHRLLTDQDWREALLTKTRNAEVVSFFHDRYDKWGRDAPYLRESTLNKVAAFSFNPYLKVILGQKENRLNLRQVMDEGKALLVDLGRCDGETRKLLGSLLVTGLEQAAASRQDTPKVKRRPCYAYIDEFQDFAANPGSVKSLAQILSECRKFGLHLTLAHQNLSQLSERMVGAIGNIQTRIVFGVSRRDAEWFAREVGQVDTEAIKHEAQTETQHPVFEPLTDQWQQWVDVLRFQPSRKAMVATHEGKTVNVWTLPIPPYTATNEQLAALRAMSLQLHGIPFSQAKQNFEVTQGQGQFSDPLAYEPPQNADA